jgi:hypothetical protein
MDDLAHDRMSRRAGPEPQSAARTKIKRIPLMLDRPSLKHVILRNFDPHRFHWLTPCLMVDTLLSLGSYHSMSGLSGPDWPGDGSHASINKWTGHWQAFRIPG